jgi:hypothetical protein
MQRPVLGNVCRGAIYRASTNGRETLYSLAKASTPGLTWIGKAATVSNSAQ